jgi:CDGSH-type Zn-finger protein/uncharacterized Fe-S cluster protein YjdI
MITFRRGEFLTAAASAAAVQFRGSISGLVVADALVMSPVGIRRYTGLDVVVTYEASRCIHAAECLRGLPAVFDTGRRPWILPDAASADAVAVAVERCPSGALHHLRPTGPAETPPTENTIVPAPRSALHVRGRIQLRAGDGTVITDDTRMTLCRCGQSKNKPFCDNTHRAIRFSDPGALALAAAPTADATATPGATLTITATTNGPYLVEGPLIIQSRDAATRCTTSRVELCRCGGSSTKPFCDGTHERIGFRAE